MEPPWTLQIKQEARRVALIFFPGIIAIVVGESGIILFLHCHCVITVFGYFDAIYRPSGFGWRKMEDARLQETTFIVHTFGGLLRSKGKWELARIFPKEFENNSIRTNLK